MRSAGEIPEALLRLRLADGLGPLLIARCFQRFGSAEAVCAASASDLAQVQGIGSATASRIHDSIRSADTCGERELIESAEVRVILRGDAEYPPLLERIDDPPILLYVRGESPSERHLALAIVGSRRCSAYGREQADRFATILAERGLTIVSGGARGIDTAAHQGALRAGGGTMAVIGCGLARVYPPENKGLFQRIIEAGGSLISELPMRFPPLAQSFLPRNRIIAGLSLGVFVVEAATRSGALSTARQAADMGRAVFALPGRIDSPSSVGCHSLLQHGSAALVTGPADIVRGLEEATLPLLGAVLTQDDKSDLAIGATLDADESQGSKRREQAPFAAGELTPQQRALYAALTESKSLAALLEETGLGAEEALSALTLLEIRALVRREGSQFQRA